MFTVSTYFRPGVRAQHTPAAILGPEDLQSHSSSPRHDTTFAYQATGTIVVALVNWPSLLKILRHQESRVFRVRETLRQTHHVILQLLFSIIPDELLLVRQALAVNEGILEAFAGTRIFTSAVTAHVWRA